MLETGSRSPRFESGESYFFTIPLANLKAEVGLISPWVWGLESMLFFLIESASMIPRETFYS